MNRGYHFFNRLNINFFLFDLLDLRSLFLSDYQLFFDNLCLHHDLVFCRHLKGDRLRLVLFVILLLFLLLNEIIFMAHRHLFSIRLGRILGKIIEPSGIQRCECTIYIITLGVVSLKWWQPYSCASHVTECILHVLKIIELFLVFIVLLPQSINYCQGSIQFISSVMDM